MKFKPTTSNRGQAALEFLTTYGWAFLVILVMIGGLSYFGVLDVSKFVPDSCKLDGNLECPTYALHNQSVELGIKNNFQSSDINVTEVKIKEVGQDSWITAEPTAPHDPSYAIESGDEHEGAEFDFDSSGDFDEFLDDKKKFDLEVYYKKGTSTITQISSGTLTTMVK
ncbi:MAG: hypothetical protein ACQESC_02790 [Nanobdellota archaeon]